MSVDYCGRELDADALRVLEVLAERGADQPLTTTEIKNAIGIEDNNRARRRMEWLAEVGLVELGTEELEDEVTRLPAKTARLTYEGADKAKKWDPADHSDNRTTTEDRINQIERKVKNVENTLGHRIEGIAGDLDTTSSQARGAMNRSLDNKDRIEDLDNRVAQVESRLTELDGHERRIKKIESYLREINNSRD